MNPSDFKFNECIPEKYISLYNILTVNINNNYVHKHYVHKHYVHKHFTKIKDVDMKILIYLHNYDLINICITCKYFLSLCRDNIFWMNKVLQRYSNLGTVEQIRNDFLGNAIWRDYYFWLVNLEFIDPNTVYLDAVYHEKLDIIKLITPGVHYNIIIQGYNKASKDKKKHITDAILEVVDFPLLKMI